jgi:dTDP-4-amino-4,6-dideoxygalactose transaminase
MDPSSTDWIGFAGARGIGREELSAVERVLSRRTLYRGAGLAPPEEVDALERELESSLGRRHAVAVNSGTSALVAALEAANVGVGDEVVVPAYGWLTDVSAVLSVGAVPVLAPVDEDLNLDPTRLPEALGPRTKAVIAVGACGLAADFAPLREATKDRGIVLIDDACQSLGARARSGTSSDVEILSFQSFKIVTGGEGGALLTDDAALYERAVEYHDAGLSRFARSRARGGNKPRGIGLNLRMAELVAAVVRVQLGRLRATLEQLASAHQELAQAFEDAKLDLRVRQAAPGADNRTYVVLVSPSEELAQEVSARLREEGCPITTAADDALHCSTGWIEYLEGEGFEHRVVEGRATRSVLGRVLTLPVNWQRSDVRIEQLRRGLARARGAIPSVR